MKPQPRWYSVFSPEYESGGYDLEPPEYGRDWLPVYTTSARRAKVLAVRSWRRRRRLPSGHRASMAWTWVTYESDLNPFRFVTTERIPPCPHGKLWCAECEDCYADAGCEPWCHSQVIGDGPDATCFCGAIKGK